MTETKVTDQEIKKSASSIAKSLRSVGFADFIRYLKSPWIIIWDNFLAGTFKGLGIIFGMTVLVAFILWIASQLIDIPVIGQYFIDIKNLLETAVNMK